MAAAHGNATFHLPQDVAAGHDRKSSPVRGALLFLIIFVVGGGYVGGRALTAVRKSEAQKRLGEKRIADTQLQVERIARAEFDAKTGLDHKRSPENDAWGHPIQVDRAHGILRGVRVVSLGPDGKLGTADDISSAKAGPIDSLRVGEAVGKEAGRFGIGMMKGLRQSLKKNGEEEKRLGDSHASAIRP